MMVNVVIVEDLKEIQACWCSDPNNHGVISNEKVNHVYQSFVHWAIK